MTPLSPELFEDLIGVEYAHMGRSVEEGLDCLGLVLEVQRRMGYTVGDPLPEYDALTFDNKFLDNASSYWKKVSAEDVEPGDIALMKYNQDKYPDHVGIVVDDRRVLHSHSKCNVCMIKRSLLGDRIVGYFRPKTKGVLVPEEAKTLKSSKSDQMEMVYVPDLFNPSSGRETKFVDPRLRTLEELVPAEWTEGETPYVVIHNGKSYRCDETANWKEVIPSIGDHVIVARTPGVTAALLAPAGTALVTSAGALTAAGIGYGLLASAINMVISLGLSLLISVLTSPPKPQRGDQNASPSFNLDGIKNTQRNGQTIGVLYGEHKVGGHIIQASQSANEEGKTTLSTLIALCEGEIDSIGGLTGEHSSLKGDAIPESIKINDEPASSYQGVEVSVRPGTVDQTSIPGFRDIVIGNSVSKTLTKDQPGQGQATNDPDLLHPVSYTTLTKIDAFEINFHFPGGLYDLVPSFDPWTVTLKIERKNKGDSTWVVLENSYAITRRKQAEFSVTYRHELPEVDQGKFQEIRVTRVGSAWPDTNDGAVSKCDLRDINEITFDDISYPGIALVGIKAQATDQLHGSIPTFTSIAKGKKVPVYDTTSSYDDPRYNFEWSNNPVWVTHDILTNKFYGLGEHYRSCDIDLESFQTAADFMTGQVDDGRGGTIARGEFNYIFDTKQPAWEAAGVPLAPFRCGLVQEGRNVKIKIEDTVDTPSQLFSMGNIIQGSFGASRRSLNEVPNVVEVQYVNEETDYEPDITQKVNATSINAGDPIRPVTINFPGVTHPSRAARAAQFALNVETTLAETINFEASVDSVAVEAGDVFAFQHDVRDVGQGGRVVTATEGVGGRYIMSFDRDITLEAVNGGNRLITVRSSADDTVATWKLDTSTGMLSAGDTTVVVGYSSVDVTGDFHPTTGDLYYVAGDNEGPFNTDIRQYRVVSTSLTQDLTRRIEGIEYNASIYSDDPGPVETFTDAAPNRLTMPANVENLGLNEYTTVLHDGSVESRLVASWNMPTGNMHPDQYDVYVRRRKPLEE